MQHQKIGSRVGGWIDGRMVRCEGREDPPDQIRNFRVPGRWRSSRQGPGPKVSFPSWAFGFPFSRGLIFVVVVVVVVVVVRSIVARGWLWLSGCAVGLRRSRQFSTPHHVDSGQCGYPIRDVPRPSILVLVMVQPHPSKCRVTTRGAEAARTRPRGRLGVSFLAIFTSSLLSRWRTNQVVC